MLHEQCASEECASEQASKIINQLFVLGMCDLVFDLNHNLRQVLRDFVRNHSVHNHEWN